MRIRKRLAGWTARSSTAPTPRCKCARLCVEELEGRVVPAQIVWTAGSAGSWSTASNWDLNRVPTSGDYVVFGSGGSNAASTMDMNVTVDRVTMDANYTSTLTIATTKTLTTTNQFVQYGTLSLSGTGAIVAGSFLDINGAVSISSAGATTARLTAAGTMYVYGSAVITSSNSTGAILHLTAGGFDCAGTINVGSAFTAGVLRIEGAFNDTSGAVINVGDGVGSTLTFITGGSSSNDPIIEGTVNMDDGTINVDSTLGTHNGTLILDGATLNTDDGDDTIQGNVWNTDGATIVWTGGFHVFTITGDYTLPTPSTPQGSVVMRIAYVALTINDTLTVGGDVDYVTVDVVASGSLPGGPAPPITWGLIAASAIDVNEVTVNFPGLPAGRTAWGSAVVGGGTTLNITLT